MSEPVPPRKRRTPTLEIELSVGKAGHTVVAGVDETGWGSLAGPISVGAAVVPREPRDQPIPEGLKDSKAFKTKRQKRQREVLFGRVKEWCTHWAVGHATAGECDQLGYLDARRLAACRALGALAIEPDVILVDGETDFVGCGNTIPVPKDDTKLTTSASIAAASILAKVVRDWIMCDLSSHFPPDYEFESNKGYYGHTSQHGEAQHKEALLALGPSGIHRRNTKFMKRLRRIGASDRGPDPLDLAGYSLRSRLFEPGGVTRSRSWACS